MRTPRREGLGDGDRPRWHRRGLRLNGSPGYDVMTADDGFPPISDYAFLSDCHSLALVARDGSIEWAVFHRFDGRPVFARILDRDIGGFFRVAPAEPEAGIERRYLPGTNVLETTFRTSTGVVTLTDFMPVEPDPDEIGVAHRLGARHSLDPYRPRRPRRRRGRPDLPPAFRVRAHHPLHHRARRRPGGGHRQCRRAAARERDRAAAARRALVAWTLAARFASRRGAGHLHHLVHAQRPRHEPHPPPRSRGQAGRDRPLLAALDGRDALRGALPRGCRAQCPGHQGPDRRPHRCGHRRGHDIAARSHRRRPQLGLPLHLGARLDDAC